MINFSPNPHNDLMADSKLFEAPDISTEKIYLSQEISQKAIILFKISRHPTSSTWSILELSQQKPSIFLQQNETMSQFAQRFGGRFKFIGAPRRFPTWQLNAFCFLTRDFSRFSIATAPCSVFTITEAAYLQPAKGPICYRVD